MAAATLQNLVFFRENPEEWLELVESKPIYQLSGIVRMIGGVGVGLEFSKSAAAFYVILREPSKTERFAEQLSTSLMENVRSQPLPDSDVGDEEGALIREQLQRSVEGVDAAISVFQMGRFCGGGETGALVKLETCLISAPDNIPVKQSSFISVF